ncbi:unnamed protein product, partial [Rotaria sordida]
TDSEDDVDDDTLNDNEVDDLTAF